MKPRHTPRTRSMGLPLTPRQRQILRFIRDHLLEHGLPPTTRQIGAALGIRSTNGVVCHLDALIGRGLIEVGSVAARGLRLVGCTLSLAYDDTEAGRRLRSALEDPT